jgi:conjugal transfer mating pair stabilization protein TraG
MASLAGYLSMSIPFMAGGLVQGMATTLNRMAQYIGGVTQSAATGAAGEAASGNLSLGNLSYNNANVQNSTGFHWDTNARVMTGQTSAELPGGATVSATADGHTLMNTQGAMSQLGTSINVAESVRTSATHQSEQAESAAYNLARAATDSASVAYRDLDELGAQQSQNQSSGQSDSLTQHGGLNEAANTLHQYAEEFANNHNFHHSQASQILGAVSGEGSIGIDKSGAISKIENLLGSFKLNGGGRGEWSYSRRGEAQQLYNEAKQYIEKHDLNTTFEHAVKAAHEGNYRVQDDESGRLAKQVSSSLDQAVSQREEAQSQFNLAENYRHLAQWAEENATSINANASQAFMDWLQHQPNPNGRGTLGPRTAEAMIAHDPELAQHYAQQYLQETTSTYMKQSEQKAGITPEQVESAGTVFDQQVKQHQADMYQRHHQQQQAIDRMADHVDVGHVDNQHQIDAQDVSHSAEHQLQTKRDLLDTANHDVKGKVEDENADNTAH